MIRLRTKPAFLLLALAIVVSGSSDAPRAEVGTFVDNTGAPLTTPLYILGSIVDDPEPIDSAVWMRHGYTLHRAVLNEQGYANGDGYPSLLLNTVTGTPIVAWAQNSPFGFDVVVSQFVSGTWTTPLVLAGTSADELDPHLVLDPATGDVHVFYWVNDANPRVMHRQAPADLSSWSAPVQVSAPTDPACRPAGVFHSGVLHVAYEVHDNGFGQTPRQVVVSRRINMVFVPEIVAITSFDGDVQPRVHSHAGRFWLDWIDAVDAAAWIRRDTSGQWEPLQHEPYQGVEERDFHVRGAIRGKAIE